MRSSWRFRLRGSRFCTMDDEEVVVVRVVCGKTAPGSVSNTFHIELPHAADVAVLRGLLADELAGDAKAIARPGESSSSSALSDSDRVPRVVFVQELKGKLG
mmetsp:Transcript_77875/g.252446  ORF Transcript_77875/g.252446 Transcript_77875/m.252446 type:complete len:102 (-) Transcript_77875:28-333(-)